MSLLITTDVECDAPGCLCWNSGVTRLHVDGKRARKLVQEQYGWTRRKNRETGKMEDLCPSCSERPKKQEAGK